MSEPKEKSWDETMHGIAGALAFKAEHGDNRAALALAVLECRDELRSLTGEVEEIARANRDGLDHIADAITNGMTLIAEAISGKAPPDSEEEVQQRLAERIINWPGETRRMDAAILDAKEKQLGRKLTDEETTKLIVDWRKTHPDFPKEGL